MSALRHFGMLVTPPTAESLKGGADPISTTGTTIIMRKGSVLQYQELFDKLLTILSKRPLFTKEKYTKRKSTQKGKVHKKEKNTKDYISLVLNAQVV